MQALFQPLASALELPDSVVYGIANTTWAIFSPAYLPFEAAVTSIAPDQVTFFRELFEGVRFATEKPLPLSDPVMALFAMACYPIGLLVLFIVSKIVGKLKCRTIGLLHNLFLFLLSLYMWAAVLVTAAAMFPRLWNLEVKSTSENDWRIAKLMWIFYISKLPEFGDTFLMVLKQNYHQISFLHLYHHSSIFLFWYYICIVAPGGDCYFSAMLNSGIHVIMYGYYFFTMLFATGRIRNFFNSIKFMITKGQMTQFMLNVVHSVYLVFIVTEHRFSIPLAKALFWYMLTLLALFGNFLIKGQRKAKAAKLAAKQKAAVPSYVPTYTPVASARPSAVVGSAVPSARPSAAAPVFEDAAGRRTTTPKRKSVRKED